jgi:hypothetical protein
MKIQTIKKFFNKVEVPPKKGKVAIAQISEKPSKVVLKKVATKKAPVKKVSIKKTIPSVLSASKKTTTKKTSVPKFPVNKTIVKKPISKKNVPIIKLVVASDSQSFWLQDGQVLNSLIALEAAFKSMSMTTYSYHVSTDGNHFADWVELVLADSVCASELRKAKTVKTAHETLKKHLASLS